MFALRNLTTGAYWGSDGWSEDPDQISRFESLEEAQDAARSIHESGFVVVVQIELEIIEMDVFDVIETREEAMK